MTLRTFTCFVLAAVVALSLFSAPQPSLAQGKKDTNARAALVSVDTVITEQARQTVPVLGRLVAAKTGVVSVITKGPVVDILVRVGDRVEPGDPIAHLSSRSLEWAMKLRNAELNSAKAQMSLRKRELQRLNNLKQSAAFSAARFEDAQQELSKAESDAARAEANLNIATIEFENATIKAPYGGVVSQVHTEIGTYLNTGQPVVTLVDDSQMELEADIPAPRIEGLTPGTPISFAVSGLAPMQATVRAVVPSENPLTRTRVVRFTPSEHDKLKGAAANQSVSISIPAGTVRDVVTVHKDAVLNKNGKRVVFVVEDGKANMRAVTLSEAVGSRFIVVSGLKEGDDVVVRGNERLFPGQSVTHPQMRGNTD